MKLQVAIDRVSIEKALELVEIFNGLVDIIEIGTSLIKDYGVIALKDINLKATKSLVLGDIKTNDEGAYEFDMGYKNGFDILTVMGNSSVDTIEKCYEVSKKYNKKMMIDLLECSMEKIKEISFLKDAIYCLHSSIDKKDRGNILIELKHFKTNFPNIKQIAVSGGIDLDTAKELMKKDIDIVVVGSSIIRKEDMIGEIKKFKEIIR